MDDLILDGNVHMRINQKELDIFTTKLKRTQGKTPSQLFREAVTAFNDGRLRIIPTEDQQQGELYKV